MVVGKYLGPSRPSIAISTDITEEILVLMHNSTASEEAPKSEGVRACNDDMLPNTPEDIEDMELDDDYETTGNSSDVTMTLSREKIDLQRKTAAKFLLALREGQHVSQAALADIISGCQELCQHATTAIKRGVEES